MRFSDTQTHNEYINLAGGRDPCEVRGTLPATLPFVRKAALFRTAGSQGLMQSH